MDSIDGLTEQNETLIKFLISCSSEGKHLNSPRLPYSLKFVFEKKNPKSKKS